MNELDAVASLDEDPLLQPARVRAALTASDRLKPFLTVLQSAASHAAAPQRAPLDLTREIAAADITQHDHDADHANDARAARVACCQGYLATLDRRQWPALATVQS